MARKFRDCLESETGIGWPEPECFSFGAARENMSRQSIMPKKISFFAARS
jgi:hypothetical protein